MNDLKSKTLRELKNVAQYYDIPHGNLTKSDLIKKISAHLIAGIIPKIPAYQSIKKMGLDLQWTLDPDEMEELCCICRPDLLSHSYEKLVYGSIDAEEGIIGLYIKKDDDIILTCVIDIGCANVCMKSSIPENKLDNYIEVNLLCSNPIHRIPGIASLVLDFVKQISAIIGKKYVLLIVANWGKNKAAVEFYTRNGFVPTDIKEIMIHTLAKTK
jgi:hypothetical protein